ncbi:sensor histidine kinase [Streptomyces liangshanensis]|uniref:Sensor histidine kinase n=1 Tax=Streptomyces liangshanensis TaxID=2717324 RepID=A0A6G9H9U2_9ACTN|nr:sensor histidine kinase [Streptomyces liangshanensis]QIQ06837.1 sensor histidine kinase [Streptomyces liangshanensis]
MWIGIWLAFLGAPLADLLSGAHTPEADVLGGIGLVAFVAVYLGLIFRHMAKALDPRTVQAALAFMFALSFALTLTLDSPWLVLFVYTSVAAGAALPPARSRPAILVVVAAMVVTGLGTDEGRDFVTSLVIPALLGGFAMSGVRQLVRTTVELREARATVAALAANEERLRLARDLHDLLGHSLSLITLKSELAGRMLPGRPDRAAEQVADIERVSRQALHDVREAVTGYRRPTLPGELAGARTALAVAGIAAEVPVEVPGGLSGDGLCEDSEAALAWSLREAVTNVVRHSAARRCVVGLTPRQTLEGPVLELTVEDDGHGASGAAYGNGLTGLTERLAKVGGTLETGTTRGGFVLTVRAPLAAARGVL